MGGWGRGGEKKCFYKLLLNGKKQETGAHLRCSKQIKLKDITYLNRLNKDFPRMLGGFKDETKQKPTKRED